MSGSLPVSTAPAERVNDFIGTLGVNTHVGQWWTSYASTTAYGGDPAKVLAAMQYLGLARVRDAVPSYNAAQVWNSSLPEYETLAAAGIRFDLGADATVPLATTMAIIDQLETADPGCVTSIEGPNEVNQNGFTFNGQTGSAAVLAYQTALYAAVRADPLLRGVPVIDFSTTDTASSASLYGDTAAEATNANLHVYTGADPLGAQLAAALAGAAASNPGQPVTLTEFGFYTQPDASAWGSVSDDVQAKYTLDGLMDAAKDGVGSTYIYELLDNNPDTNGYSQENHFGLFNTDGTPKQAATALHNLIAILADPGAAAASFAPTALADTVSGLPATGSSLLLQKSDGTWDLVLWAEPEIWNRATLSETAAPAAAVTVQLGATYAAVQVFDPLTGTVATSTLGNVSSVTVAVSDHPVVIQISPQPGTAAQAVPASPAVAVPANSPAVSPSTAAVTVRAAAPADPSLAQQAAAAGGQMATATGTEYVSPTTVGGEVDLLYTAILGHQPDAAGLGYWAAAVAAGTPIDTIAAGLLASPEYQAVHGGDGNATFVAGLYQSLLGRTPDAAGLGYWTGVLDGGSESRADLATGFITTPEIVAIQSQPGAASGLASGLFGIDPDAVTVAATYQTILGRAPDAAGLAGWVAAMHAGLSEADLLGSFMATPEFAATAGAASATAFVGAVETNAYGGSDAGGVAYWGAAIDSGAASRADVAMAYVNSAAMAARVMPGLLPG